MTRHTMSVMDFARELAVSERTVRRLVAAGRVPVLRVGRRLVVPRDAALAALHVAQAGGLWPSLRAARDVLDHEIARRRAIDTHEIPELVAARAAIESVLLALDAETAR